MQIRSSARPMIAARLFAALSFTGMVATGSFVALVSHADTAWAAPKKKKKPKAAAADTSSDDTSTSTAPVPTRDVSSTSTDDLMNESTKTKSNRQIKAEKEAAADSERPEKQKVSDEPDAWERPPVEEEKPKHKAFVPVEERKGDGRRYDLALLVGWAGQTSKYFASDPWGLGFGLRGAYEFDNHLVLGVGYEYFIGSSITSSNLMIVTTSRVNYMLAHAEVGYDFWLADNRVILRPSLWVGLAIGTQNPPMASGTSGVETSLFFAPGLTFHYLLGDNGWFLGADARFTIITGNGANGFLALATFGLRFGH